MSDIEILVRTLTDGIHFKHKTLKEGEKENDEDKNVAEEKTFKDKNAHGKCVHSICFKCVHSICFNLEKKNLTEDQREKNLM